MTIAYILDITSAGLPLRIDRGITDVGAEHQSSSGEVPSLRVVLDNARGQLTQGFCPPPLGAPAVLYAEGGEVFAGTVQAVTLGATIDVEIEA